MKYVSEITLHKLLSSKTYIILPLLLGLAAGTKVATGTGQQAAEAGKYFEDCPPCWLHRTTHFDQYTSCYRYTSVKKTNEGHVLVQNYEVEGESGTSRQKDTTNWYKKTITGNDGSSSTTLVRMRDRDNITYQLKYSNEKENCFIVTFTQNGNNECDLYVRKNLPNEEGELPECVKQLPIVCGRPVHRKYFAPNCQQ